MVLLRFIRIKTKLFFMIEKCYFKNLPFNYTVTLEVYLKNTAYICEFSFYFLHDLIAYKLKFRVKHKILLILNFSDAEFLH